MVVKPIVKYCSYAWFEEIVTNLGIWVVTKG